jgi:hypothetical protein
MSQRPHSAATESHAPTDAYAAFWQTVEAELAPTGVYPTAHRPNDGPTDAYQEFMSLSEL